MPIKLDNPGGPKISDKVLPESESRKRILAKCRELGCEREMLQIFDKYDKLLANCRNDSERADISKLGVYEAYSLLDKGGKLYVQNELIYVDKDDPANNEPKIII